MTEAFYDLPLAIALALQDAHAYDAALDWFRLVYDYAQPPTLRKTYYGLALDEHGVSEQAAADPKDYARRLLDWVRDPLDPHATAATRPHTYTRGTLQLLIRCILDYADAEFTRDTSESIARARILYETARELLDLPVLNQRLDGCADVIVRMPRRPPPARLRRPSAEQPDPRGLARRHPHPGACSCQRRAAGCPDPPLWPVRRLPFRSRAHRRQQRRQTASARERSPPAH